MSDRDLSRRRFLLKTSYGLGSVALASLMGENPAASGLELQNQSAAPLTRSEAKAKSVIWLFMVGGASHLETFDPKPALNTYAGKQIIETPHKDVLDNPFVKANVREFVPGRRIYQQLYPLQVGFSKAGQSGIEVSDWLPYIRENIDDIAVVRSMWTTDNDHAAQLQFHTGRHVFDGIHPTIGAWIHYGLGRLSDNLPQFVVMGQPIADCCGGIAAHGAGYLGPEHGGVHVVADPKNPLQYGGPGPDVYTEEQRRQFELLRQLNQLTAQAQPHDAATLARIRAYELAFLMQDSIPQVMRFEDETPETLRLYGIDRDLTRPFGQQCLAARRLVERGVRFVQIFHGANGSAGSWDGHSNLQSGHTAMCGQVDQPIAALLRDLKRRGMLDETIVVWGTEFGRTPGAESSNGRDHHPFGFSVWLAGGGVRGGTVHGSTDELGFHAVEDRHYVTDLHATVLRQLGIDSRQLEFPGRKRLEIDFGKPIMQILDS